MGTYSEARKSKNEFLLDDGTFVTGTLVWYSAICEREVWLMSRNITPDSEDQSLDFGRAIHDVHYRYDKKEVEMEGIKLDIVKEKQHVVCEVKTSSRYIESAELQLLYYLYRLRIEGYEFSGKILIPKEKKVLNVEFNEEGEKKIKDALMKIKDIARLEAPPRAKFIPFCRKCAYRYFCWSE